MNKPLILIFTLIFLLPAALCAQKQKTERAYAAYESGSYWEAIDLFKDVYSKTRDKQV
jgi:hypothetical protein